MTSRDFCFWLQGYFELRHETELHSKQVEVIKNHLRLVFAHEIDPKTGPQNEQDFLSQLHQGSLQSTIPDNATIARC